MANIEIKDLQENPNVIKFVNENYFMWALERYCFWGHFEDEHDSDSYRIRTTQGYSYGIPYYEGLTSKEAISNRPEVKRVWKEPVKRKATNLLRSKYIKAIVQGNVGIYCYDEKDLKSFISEYIELNGVRF